MTNPQSYKDRIAEILAEYDIGEFTYIETKSAVTSLMQELCSEVIGEDDPIVNTRTFGTTTAVISSRGAMTKNKLRADQRKRLKELL